MKTSFYINEFKLCNFKLCVCMYVDAAVGFIFVIMIKKFRLPEYVGGLYDNRHEINIRWRECLDCFVLLNSTCIYQKNPVSDWGLLGGGSAGNNWLFIHLCFLF